MPYPKYKWFDPIVETPGRRTLTVVNDESGYTVDVATDERCIINAYEMNGLEDRIDSALREVIDMSIFEKVTWENRVSENQNRRVITVVSGDMSVGTETVVDVQRGDTNITKVGTPVNADAMNDLEDRIEAAVDEVEARAVAPSAVGVSF